MYDLTANIHAEINEIHAYLTWARRRKSSASRWTNTEMMDCHLSVAIDCSSSDRSEYFAFSLSIVFIFDLELGLLISTDVDSY